jgi:hypothetical protein
MKKYLLNLPDSIRVELAEQAKKQKTPMSRVIWDIINRNIEAKKRAAAAQKVLDTINSCKTLEQMEYQVAVRLWAGMTKH